MAAKRKKMRVEPAWKKAVEDVVAATIHAQVRLLAMGAHLPHQNLNHKSLSQGVLSMLDDAKHLYKMVTGGHECADSGCICRHKMLLSINARNAANAVGIDYHEAFEMSVRQLEAYMARAVN